MRKIIQKDKKGNIINTYDDIIDIVRELSIDKDIIIKNLHGLSPSVRDFIFEYNNTPDNGILHYNNPDRAKERAEPQPLSMYEEETVVWLFNKMAEAYNTSDVGIKQIQRFIDTHENMQHQLAVAGGPEGITKLLQRSDAIYDFYINLKEIVAKLESNADVPMVQAVITAHKVTLDSLRQMLIKTAYNSNDDFEKNL